jgi:hypothetical protein
VVASELLSKVVKKFLFSCIIFRTNRFASNAYSGPGATTLSIKGLIVTQYKLYSAGAPLYGRLLAQKVLQNWALGTKKKQIWQ